MGKVQDSILRVYENMTAVERSIADFFMSNEEPMDFSSRNVAGMLPTGKCILNCRKALAGMIPAGKIDPELQKSSCRDDFQRENAS